jgi:truncated hemoglobin YjbI
MSAPATADDDHDHPAATGLYARLGGSPALEAAVEIFYDLNLKAWPLVPFHRPTSTTASCVGS